MCSSQAGARTSTSRSGSSAPASSCVAAERARRDLSAPSSIAAISDEASSPITNEYPLRCSAAHAFATYTGRIGEWWDPRYSANAETLEAVTIEPRVGGRVYATHSDIGEHEWGEVTVWESGLHLVHTFTLAQDAQHPSEVAVEFVPDEGEAATGCTVRFAHGGWTEANAGARKKFADWRVLLDRFASLADSNR